MHFLSEIFRNKLEQAKNDGELDGDTFASFKISLEGIEKGVQVKIQGVHKAQYSLSKN